MRGRDLDECRSPLVHREAAKIRCTVLRADDVDIRPRQRYQLVAEARHDTRLRASAIRGRQCDETDAALRLAGRPCEIGSTADAAHHRTRRDFQVHWPKRSTLRAELTAMNLSRLPRGPAPCVRSRPSTFMPARSRSQS